MTEEEQLILVRESGRATGAAGKAEVHRRGLLHRAFSIFLVDEKGRLLVQRRSPAKYHSGGLWANSCCGHPRPGEPTGKAASRRLREELGVDARLRLHFIARYRAEIGSGLVENERVHVYFGRLDGAPEPNPHEVSEVDLLPWDALDRLRADRPETLAAWLIHYLDAHGPALRRAAAETLAP